MYRAPLSGRLTIGFAAALTACAGCGNTAVLPSGGAQFLSNPITADLPGDVAAPTTASSDDASSALAVVISRPFCCNPLERIFAADLGDDAVLGGATCRWEFSDGFRISGCEVSHSFSRSGIFTATLLVTLTSGEQLETSVDVSVGQTADSTDGSGVSANGQITDPVPIDATDLRVDAGRDIEVFSGRRVTLSGTVIAQPATAMVNYSWQPLSTPATEIIDSDTLDAASFRAPFVTVTTTISFALTADSGGVSAEDVVTVTVVPIGDEIRVNDPRWGFDPSDATEAIQAAIDSGVPTVVIADIGQPWVVRPLTLRSRLHLLLEPGAVLEAKENEFHGINDALLLANDVTDLFLEGYGATIRMRKADYTTQRYAISEWRHGLSLEGVVNSEVAGLRVEQSGGDGIYVGPTPGNPRIPCQNVVLRDCACSGSYRNGISIVSASDLTVEGCTITETSGTAPQAGVLVEPSDKADVLTNIRVRNCTVENNAGTGFMVNLSKLDSESDPIDVIVEDGTVRNSVQPGLRAILREELGATGTFEFLRCQVLGTRLSGTKLIWDVRSAIALRLTQCSWSDVARGVDERFLEFELTGSGAAVPGGGVSFTDCQLQNAQTRPLLRVIAEAGTEYSEIMGNISVTGVQPVESVSPQLPGLQITYDGG